MYSARNKEFRKNKQVLKPNSRQPPNRLVEDRLRDMNSNQTIVLFRSQQFVLLFVPLNKHIKIQTRAITLLEHVESIPSFIRVA